MNDMDGDLKFNCIYKVGIPPFICSCNLDYKADEIHSYTYL